MRRDRTSFANRRLRRADYRQGADNGFGALMQGSVETSNVDIVSEITNLISAQRAYEMNSKVIKTTDEMLSTVGQLKS